MATMPWRDILRGLVDAAVQDSVRWCEAHRPGAALAGFAIVTDDDLVTATCHAVFADELADAEEPDLLFMASDWPHEHAPAWSAVAVHLRRRRGTQERRTVFEVFVDALLAARDDGTFPQGTLVHVMSSDPDEEMARWEEAAVAVLNPRDLTEAYQVRMAAWQADVDALTASVWESSGRQLATAQATTRSSSTSKNTTKGKRVIRARLHGGRRVENRSASSATAWSTRSTAAMNSSPSPTHLASYQTAASSISASASG